MPRTDAQAKQGQRSTGRLQGAANGRPQTLWPTHCVQGSAGARLCGGIDWDKVALIPRKGMQPDVDSYSALYSAAPCPQRRAR